MPVENATFLADLNSLSPAGSEYVSEGDNHLRLIKRVLQNTFQGFNGSILNYCGVTTNADNNYTVTTSFNIPSYTEGMIILCFINAENTGSSFLRINSLPFVPIRTMKGETLSGKELKTNQLAMFVYRNGNFYLINSDLDYELINSLFTSATNLTETRFESATNLTETRYTSATNLTLHLFDTALGLGFQNWANITLINTLMTLNNIK